MSGGLDTTDRSLDELKARARPALQNEALVKIAAKSTPNGSYFAAKKRFKDEELAKACRWLAMIRRDYGRKAFLEFTGTKP